MSVMNRKTKQGQDRKVKAGDQTADAKTKKNYPKSKMDQGDACCSASDFTHLTGKEGALQMSPKVTAQPSKGPFDAMAKGGKAGYSKDMPDSGQKTKELTPMKSRPARNSRNK